MIVGNGLARSASLLLHNGMQDNDILFGLSIIPYPSPAKTFLKTFFKNLLTDA